MTIPKHIAIICDGNRRWAKRLKKPEFAGHRHALETTTENLVDHCLKLKIPYITFWFFSTENWNRGKLWTKRFFDLFRLLLPKTKNHYLKKGVKFNHIGDLTPLPADVRQAFLDWEEESKDKKQITVTIAFNYGGQDELVRAVNKIKTRPIRAKDIAKNLDTANMPDPDLLIRTGKNNTRLSGFMLWQLAYTQLHFINTLYPDLTPKRLDSPIAWWRKQTVNLGK